MIKYLLIFIVPFISSCALFEPKIEYVEVKVPVISCPIPPKIQMPKLLITELTKEDYTNYNKVAKYFDATIQQLIDHIDELTLIVESYRK